MAKYQDIDRLLKDWPYEPGEVLARIAKARDGRDVIQMRVEMGILQMEVNRRPDGQRPNGFDTYYDHLLAEALHAGKEFELTEEQCSEADREFMQYYHRRICWLSLREFHLAARDADHTLAFMDFVAAHCNDEEWIVSHEQYRPFVMFHQVQARALAKLEDDGAEGAIGEINAGLKRFHDLFAKYDAEERYEDDELVRRLEELKESLREHYSVGRTLDEQLADAVAAEQYELAAKLRDQLSRRGA